VKSHLYEVREGVYYVYVDFCERVVQEMSGSSSIEDRYAIYFSRGEDYLDMVEVVLPFNCGDGYMFGEMDKDTYHGTYYDYEKFCEIVSEENEFLTGV